MVGNAHTNGGKRCPPIDPLWYEAEVRKKQADLEAEDAGDVALLS